MIEVSIIMGSDSDLPVMGENANILEQLGIEYEKRSYRRTDKNECFEWCGLVIFHCSNAGRNTRGGGAINSGLNAVLLSAKILGSFDEEISPKIMYCQKQLEFAAIQKAKRTGKKWMESVFWVLKVYDSERIVN